MKRALGWLRMNSSRLTGVALVMAALSLLSLSCAVPMSTDGPGAIAAPPAASMSAAKMGLPPAFRVFHDELDPYGDWVLIEPYGYVFRPDVNTLAWRPYQYGWWTPSDVFGWVWDSDEPFGWITYHYGTWFHDDYQGWVWTPGSQWGPAWVAWVTVGDWIGWAPLAPLAYDRYRGIPGGVFLFASTSQFGRDDQSMRSTFVSSLARTDEPITQIVRLAHVDGVTINKGPDPAFVQRGGGLPNDREDIAPQRLGLPRVADDDGTQLMQRTKKLFAEAQREWGAWSSRGAAPKPAPGGTPRPQIWRKPAPKPLGGPALVDSLRSDSPRDSVRFKPRGGGGVRKPGARPVGGAAADSTR